jgi:hypothetical protein
MSKISDAYQVLIDLIKSEFTDRIELKNPYVLDDNEDIILKSGFGVTLLPTTNLKRVTSCIYTLEREVQVVFTNQVFGTNRDMGPRQSVEKFLMDEQLKLIKAIDASGNLNDLLAKRDFSGDNGIEFVFSERNNYLALTSSFLFEYHQNINQ